MDVLSNILSVTFPFFGLVLCGYLVAWPVGFVCVMLVRPLVLRLVQMTVAHPPQR